MDRRTFLKAMGAVFASIPFNTSGSQQAASPSGNEKTVAAPPRFRLIAVGNASTHNILESFDSSIPDLHPDEMMYLDKDGLLRRCSGLSDADCCGIEESRLACNRSIGHLDTVRSRLGESEREIAEFVRGGEWLFIYAVLDNAVAFAASERIARIARDAGVKTIAFVATPYECTNNTFGYAEEFKCRNEMLGAASRAVVEGLYASCNGVFHNEGVWHSEEDLTPNWFTQQNVTVNVLAKIFSRTEYAEQLDRMLVHAGNCVKDYAVENDARKAVQYAIYPYAWPNRDGLDRHVTSGGAIIVVTGHPDNVDKLKHDILDELKTPSVFHREGYPPFWRDGSEFLVVTNPYADCAIEHSCVVTIFSTGVSAASSV